MNELKNKNLLIGLSVSIIVNVFLIGFLFSNVFMYKGCRRNQNRQMMSRHAMGDNFWNQNKEKLDELRSQIKGALLNEPYNKEEVINAFNKLENKMSELRKEFHDKIAQDAINLSPEERLELLPPMGKDFMGKHRRHKRRR